jgi:miniconductance mechanosensitive channel
MFTYFEEKFKIFYQAIGFNDTYTEIFVAASELLIAALISYIGFRIAKNIILHMLKTAASRTKSNWDDIIIERKVFDRLAYLVPAYIFYWLLPYALDNYHEFVKVIMTGIEIYTVVIIMAVFLAFLNAVLHIYQGYEISKSKPIKGYIQVVKIIIYIIGSLTIISMMIGKSPLLLIGGLGAFSAVLLLVFKDTILGLVAGVQLTSNDMLRVGEWISMPKYGADGIVLDISLTTVKVQNWDKTISTIPAYALFTDSFVNWRGMEESGGRRIKRSVNIDMNSIKFCTPEMLKKFERFQYISDYVKNKQAEIEKYNKEHHVDPDLLVNGRRQTNIGVFRAYLEAYLKNNPKIHQSMTFLVRHLQPTEKGLPIEIYVFSKIQEWAEYEAIQADIFDHVLAVIPQFELRVFQNPTGADFKSWVENMGLSPDPGENGKVKV